MYIYLTFLVLLAPGILGQVPFIGNCPAVKDVQQNFDVNRFSIKGTKMIIRTKKPFYMEGYATPAGDPSEAKLLIHFTSPIHFNGPYWILETDYDSYAVVWSCSQYPGFNIQLAWILTRDRDYAPEALEKAHAVFDRSNLTRKILYKLDQTNCPSYV